MKTDYYQIVTSKGDILKCVVAWEPKNPITIENTPMISQEDMNQVFDILRKNHIIEFKLNLQL